MLKLDGLARRAGLLALLLCHAAGRSSRRPRGRTCQSELSKLELNVVTYGRGGKKFATSRV